jgi:hypothetical protein
LHRSGSELSEYDKSQCDAIAAKGVGINSGKCDCDCWSFSFASFLFGKRKEEYITPFAHAQTDPIKSTTGGFRMAKRTTNAIAAEAIDNILPPPVILPYEGRMLEPV